MLGGVLGRVDVRRHRRRIGARLGGAGRPAAARRSPPRRRDERQARRPRAVVAQLRRRRPGRGPVACLDRLGAGDLADRDRSAPARRASGSASWWPARCMADPGLVLLDEPTAGPRPRRPGGAGRPPRRRWPPTRPRRRSVLVTHHVEEIPPRFTHALLLRDGRISAAGPIDEVLRGRRPVEPASGYPSRSAAWVAAGRDGPLGWAPPRCYAPSALASTTSEDGSRRT